MNRRTLFHSVLFSSFAVALLSLPLVGTVQSAESKPVQPKVVDKIAWYNVQDWGVEGKGWSETERYFDRLPKKAHGVVRAPVWSLSRHSAGMCVHFETDATTIWVNYKVLSSSLAMPHMPATGVSGLDLYAKDDSGNWRWLAVTRPTAQTMKVKLVTDIQPGYRAYTIYLPLYNGTESLEIGVSPESKFKPIAPRTKPIIFYGTSITHGGCASRTGMAYPAILGRRLKCSTLNLGFSGNGRMDPEVADLLAELDPAIYVIDCVPNMRGPEVAERTEPLVHRIRKSRPNTPIVLVEDRTYGYAWLKPDVQDRQVKSRAALKAAYEHLKAEGVKGLYYVEGKGQLGTDDEAMVDGSHPTDLGMMRMADTLEPVLRPLMKKK